MAVEIASSEFDVHCDQVARAIADGRVVPLLGAGANLCGRTIDFTPGAGVLPSGAELARHLAAHFGFDDDSGDLVRTAQYVAAVLGEEPLYQELHDLFAAEYGPTSLHLFLARVPKLVAALPDVPRHAHQLIVTTNYDDALERAFEAEEVEFDLVTYICLGDDRGHFMHRAPDGTTEVIRKANEYQRLDLAGRTVILKIHGAVDRSDSDNDSYVITEDDYIDYLTRTDVSLLLPQSLVAKLRRSHMLFLGYSLRDWNLRAIFHRIWQERPRTSASWAIQKNADRLDMRFWQGRGVEIFDAELHTYIDELELRLRRLGDGMPL